jgi:hypothetical protein
MFQKLIYVAVLLIQILWYLLDQGEFSITLVTVNLIIVFISTIIFLISNNSAFFEKQYFRHSLFILVGVLIVHFQYYVDLLMGNLSILDSSIWVNTNVINKAILLSSMGVISFFFGYISLNKKPVATTDSYKVSFVGTMFLKFCGLAFLILYFYLANPIYFLGNYGIIDVGTEAAYVIALFEVCISAAIIQNTRNLLTFKKNFDLSPFEYLKYQGVLLNIILVIYLISVLVSGDRGAILFFILLYAGNYLFLTKRKIRLSILFLGVFLGSSFITYLGDLRTISGEYSFFNKIKILLNEEIDSRFATQSIIPQTQNLASSIRCLNFAVNHVPSKHDFLYGRFQFQQIMSSIPFSSTFNNFFFIESSIKYRSSADFITWIDQGDFPFSGNGTTVIADYYCDFGLIGVLFGLFIVGYSAKYSEFIMYSLKNVSLFKHTLSIIILASSFYLSRSSFFILFKFITWTYIFLVLNKNIFNKAT